MRYQNKTTVDLLLALCTGAGVGWVVGGPSGGIIGGLLGEGAAVISKVIGPYLPPRSKGNVKEEGYAYSSNP